MPKQTSSIASLDCFLCGTPLLLVDLERGQVKGTEFIFAANRPYCWPCVAQVGIFLTIPLLDWTSGMKTYPALDMQGGLN